MNWILNIMWFFSGRFKESLHWGFTGVAKCRKLTGIPVGVQHFKFAGMTLHPFGRKVTTKVTFGTVVLNGLWLMSNGASLAAAAVWKGFWLCLSGVGIPFGLQWFKFARLALFPFGTKIIKVQDETKVLPEPEEEVEEPVLLMAP